MKSKLDKLNELGELLKSGTISQKEFDNLKNELLNPQKQSEENSKQKAKFESSASKRTSGIDRKLSKNEKKILKKDQEGLNIKPFIVVIVLLAVFGFYKNYDSGSDNISNPNNKSDNSNSNSYQYEEKKREATHMCKICLTKKKESKMSHISDVLDSDFWICNDNNGRCSRQRYKRVRQYNEVVRQTKEYHKNSGFENPFN